MKNKLLKLFTLLISMSLAGCGGGSSTSETVTGLSTPAGVELITDNSSSSSNLASLNYAAFTDVGTDYSTDKVQAY
jgi:hypothetical protein